MCIIDLVWWRGHLGGSAAKRPTSAQVMISQFVSLSPTLGSVLKAQNLEPASDSVSPCVSAFPRLCFVSLSLSKIKINIKKKKDLVGGNIREPF